MDLKMFDLKGFWEENDYCSKNFDKKTRIPIHFWLDDHFLFELVGPFSTQRYYKDIGFRAELHKKANDILEEKLGRRFYSEDKIEYPEPTRFEVVMGSEVVISEGATPWLEPAITSCEEIKDLISNLEKIDVKNIISTDLIEKKNEYENKTSKKVVWGNLTRGPATIATSILGTTNLCLLLMDEPEMMDDFFMILAEKLVEYIKTLRIASENVHNGISINDDNCFLFSPKLYERYCAPVLLKLFNEFAPNKNDVRYQHSDSNMEHLIPILNDLGVNAVNFGPEIHPATIRKLMPNAKIYGQMPPFVLRNGNENDIVEIVKRDMMVLKEDGNFVETPAGSVSAGTPLENIKVYMWAVQEYDRL